jgi:DHA2 family multidrug resistance protein-like MFS transporter
VISASDRLPGPHDVPDGLAQPERFRSIVVILLGIAVSVLDSTIVNLALPGIARDLQTSAAATVWVVNAYQLGILTLLLPCAALGDLVGYRRVYLAGTALFTVASIGCLFATSLPMLAGFRGVQGIGAAGIMAVNPALMRLTYPARMLGRGIALNSAVVATASVAGPTVAAGILSVASWPWLFALNLPLGALVLAVGWRALPRNVAAPPAGARLRAGDVVLNILMFSLVFLGADLLGVHSGVAQGPSQRLVGFALLGTGLAVGAVYLSQQRRRPVPLFPVDLLRIPVFALSMATSVCAFVSQLLSSIALPFLLLESLGRNHLEAGLLLTAWPLAIVAVAPVAGRLIGRYPGGLLGGIGMGVLASGLALLAGLPPHPAGWDIAWRLALCGVGFGLFQSPNNHTIVTSAPLRRSGAASGMLGTARLTGQTLGALIMAMVLGVWSVSDGGAPTVALGLACGFAAVSGLLSLLRLRSAS